MTEFPTRSPHGPALPQMLHPIHFSTTTWLMIYAILKNHPINGQLEHNRAWAADHIMGELLSASGLTEVVDDVRPTNPA